MRDTAILSFKSEDTNNNFRVEERQRYSTAAGGPSQGWTESHNAVPAVKEEAVAFQERHERLSEHAHGMDNYGPPLRWTGAQGTRSSVVAAPAMSCGTEDTARGANVEGRPPQSATAGGNIDRETADLLLWLSAENPETSH